MIGRVRSLVPSDLDTTRRRRRSTEHVFEGSGPPDFGAVDAVARLALLAGRLDARLEVTEVSPAMQELLELAGLPVEVERQAERREEPLGVEESQEEVHPGDLPA